MALIPIAYPWLVTPKLFVFRRIVRNIRDELVQDVARNMVRDTSRIMPRIMSRMMSRIISRIMPRIMTNSRKQTSQGYIYVP